MNKKYSALPSTFLALFLFTLSLRPIEAAVVLSDGTFDDTAWTLTTFLSGNGGGMAAQQITTGGNPGTFRQVVTTVNDAGATAALVRGYHIGNLLTYEPAVSGAVGSLVFQSDFLTIGAQIGLGLAIEQSGHFFYGAYGIDRPLVWTSFTTTPVLPSSFVSQDGAILDVSASAAPLNFGYFTANSTDPGQSGYTGIVKLDNFRVTVNVVPEPSAALLLISGAVLAFTRRSSRRTEPNH